MGRRFAASGWGWVAAGLALIIVAPGTWVTPPAEAHDAAGLGKGVLPTARWRSAPAWTGEELLLFGGYTWYWASTAQRDVLRYDPATETARRDAFELPFTYTGGSAVWDPRDLPGLGCEGGCAYLFGGNVDGARSDAIHRVNLARGEVGVLDARLPSPRELSSAVWDGQFAYVVGGYVGGVWPGSTDEVVRFDPLTGEAELLPFRLPTRNAAMAAVWTGAAAYLFGHWEYGLSDRVVRVDPAAGVAEEVGARLPGRSEGLVAGWDGDTAHVQGSRWVARFTPATGEVVRSDAPDIPWGPRSAAGVWAGDALHVVGGYGCAWVFPYGCQAVITDRIAVLPTPARHLTARIAPIPTLECEGRGAWATLDARGSFDPDGAPLAYAWTSPGATIPDPAAARTEAWFPLGASLLTLDVSAGGRLARAMAQVLVLDTEPPVVTWLRPGEGEVHVGGAVAVTVPDEWDQLPRRTVAIGPLTAEVGIHERCGLAEARFEAWGRVAQGPYQSLGVHAPAGPPWTWVLDPTPAATGWIDVAMKVRDFRGFRAEVWEQHFHVGTGICPTSERPMC
jgi:hypothetical protein